MWGICLNSLADGGKLYQRAIEYENGLDKNIVHILRPVSNIKICVNEIKTVDKLPAFIYGELVSPVGHSDIIGKITDIIWHYKNNDYNYYISVNGRKKSKRYYAEDLIKLEQK